MIVRHELNKNIVLQQSTSEIISTLEFIKRQKEDQIENLKYKIIDYENNKRAEAAFYQSLSPVRRFFTSGPPSHHQAVEYLVHVKERQKQIENIKQRILEIDYVIQQIESKTDLEEITLSVSLIDEIKVFQQMEDM